jgi:hypothetical protein
MHTRLNIFFGVVLLAFALQTILWHNRAYNLYLDLQKAIKLHIVALDNNQQLLNKKSFLMSGVVIEHKAIKVLDMHYPDKKLSLKL